MLTLAILSFLHGHDGFLLMSALFIFNGLIGSLFLNRILSENGLSNTNSWKLIFVILLIAAVYVYTILGLLYAAIVVPILIVRLTHDYTRKKSFIFYSISEVLPSCMKLFLSIILYFEYVTNQTLAISLYTIAYLAGYLYYQNNKSITVSKSMQISNLNTSILDKFILMRVFYRNFVLLSIPVVFHNSPFVETFLLIWTTLAISAYLNDFVEKFFIENVELREYVINISPKMTLFCALFLIATWMQNLSGPICQMVILAVVRQLFYMNENILHIITIKGTQIYKLKIEFFKIFLLFVIVVYLFYSELSLMTGLTLITGIEVISLWIYGKTTNGHIQK